MELDLRGGRLQRNDRPREAAGRRPDIRSHRAEGRTDRPPERSRRRRVRDPRTCAMTAASRAGQFIAALVKHRRRTG